MARKPPASIALSAPKLKIDLQRYLPVLLIAFVLTAPPILHRANYYMDYGAHLGWAREWLEQGTLWEPPRPHFLFHLLVIWVYQLSGTLSWEHSGAVVTISFSLLTAAILYDWAMNALSASLPFRQRVALSTAVAASLLIVAPINFGTYFDNNLYLGYIDLSTYHSPTIIVLRPLALLLFAYIANVISTSESANSPYLILSAVIVAIVGTLAKPNFSLDLLPALALITGLSILKRRALNWPLILSVGTAIALILAWQYLYFYDQGKGVVEEDSHIIFAPLLASTYFADQLFLKFILSIAFPAAVYMLYWQQARKDTALTFAWLLFVISLFDTYFMAEIRDGFPTSNFLWSSQITLFILFARSVIFLLGIYSQEGVPQDHQSTEADPTLRTHKSLITCAAFYAMHLIGGVLWYWVQLSELFPDGRSVADWF